MSVKEATARKRARVGEVVAMPMPWSHKTITASTWITAVEAVFHDVESARGLRTVMYPGIDGEPTERKTAPLCNADVIAIVESVLADVPTAKKKFGLWYQFAAVAYGWDPEKSDKLNTSAQWGAKYYPALITVELWKELASLASLLDSEHVADPRFDLDATFTDKVFAGEVRAALMEDGASATISEFRIPVPHMCEGERGKGPRNRKCTKRMERFPYACLEYEKCKAPTVDIDPTTGLRRTARSAFWIVALAVGLLLLSNNNAAARRRKG